MSSHEFAQIGFSLHGVRVWVGGDGDGWPGPHGSAAPVSWLMLLSDLMGQECEPDVLTLRSHLSHSFIYTLDRFKPALRLSFSKAHFLGLASRVILKDYIICI